MSDVIETVLRHGCLEDPSWSTPCANCLGIALEALAVLRAERDEAMNRCDAAILDMVDAAERAEAAEATVVSLREALREIDQVEFASLDASWGQKDQAATKVQRIARAALASSEGDSDA